MKNSNYDYKQILKLMKERRSIRSFKSKKISDEELDIILEGARWSQSANNSQPWKIIVIKNAQIIKQLEKLAPYGNFISQTSIVLAIVELNDISPKWGIYDTSIMTQQISLIAWSLGIGTCWIGSMDRKKAAELLNLKEGEELTTIMPLGYPKKVPKPTSRKSIESLVEYIE